MYVKTIMIYHFTFRLFINNYTEETFKMVEE